MSKFADSDINGEIARKNTFMRIWENQHPVMYWWFALTSLSLCSVYAILFTKF